MRRVPSHQHPSLRPAIVASAIVHLVVLILFIAVPDLRFRIFDRPIKIDVMWVELPRGTSEEIGLGLKKAKDLPKSTIEEQRKLFEPEAKDQESLKPKMRAPVVAKEEAPPARPKPKVPKEMKVRKPSRTDRKIANALAKIDKQIKNRRIVPEAAQVRDDADGFKYGTGTKPLKVAPSDPEYLMYQAKVRAKIIREWVVPAKYTQEGAGNFNAQVAVMINDDGEVVSVRWASPSGDATFDQSAIRAVKRASPLPKPPDRLAWEAYNEGFLVEFDPTLKPRY